METQMHQLKQDLLDLINNLISRIDSIASMFGNQQSSEANERLVFLAEDISVAAQTAMMMKETCTNLDLDELNAKLSLLLEQMEAGDLLFVSDMLSFELKPLFEYWSEQLQDA